MLLTVGVLAANTFADLKVVSNMTVGDGSQASNRKVTTYYKGDWVRTDSGQTVQIVNTRTQTMTILSLRDKTFRTIELKSVMGANPALKNAKLSASAKVARKPERKTILGRPAQHYVGEATIAFNFAGMASSQPGMTMQVTMDSWTCESLPTPKGASGGLGLGQASNAMFFRTPEVARELAKIKGFPLVTRMTVANVAGSRSRAGRSQTVTTQAQQVLVAPLSDQLFKIPSGYRKASAKRSAAGLSGIAGHSH